MIQPELVMGNVFIRPNVLAEVGDRVAGHKHQFDHVTILYQGGIHVHAVLPDGTVLDRDYTAPSRILIRAQVEHEITALEANTLFDCIYAHRDPQGRVTQAFTGWEPAYT